MSTRAVVTIHDESDSYHVYTHSDGYPEYQVVRIVKALKFAWPLPRYEAMDFGAAFVAANKEAGGGGIYLTTSWEAHGDLEYRYDITAKGKSLFVRVYSINSDGACFPIWAGDIDAMKRKFKSEYLKGVQS